MCSNYYCILKCPTGTLTNCYRSEVQGIWRDRYIRHVLVYKHQPKWTCVKGLIFSDIYRTSKDQQTSIIPFYWHTCSANAQNHLNRDLAEVNSINYFGLLNNFKHQIPVSYKSIATLLARWKARVLKGKALKSTQKLCCKTPSKSVTATAHEPQSSTVIPFLSEKQVPKSNTWERKL